MQNGSFTQHRSFFRALIICVAAISLALPGLAFNGNAGRAATGIHDANGYSGIDFPAGDGSLHTVGAGTALSLNKSAWPDFPERPELASVQGKRRPIRVLMVGGGESHNFDKWYRGADAATLRRDGLATVIYTDNTDSIIYYLPKTDVLFLCNNQPIRDPGARQAIFDFVRKGKGLVLAHAALWYNWKDWPEYNLQLAGGGSRGHDAYGPFKVTITNPAHPVMVGLPASLTLSDERYYYIPDPASPGVELLAIASAEGADKTFPSVFLVKNPKARIVGIALGHDGASHDLPEYQTLLRNAIKWVSKRK